MTKLASSLIIGSISLLVQFLARKYLAEDFEQYLTERSEADYSLPQIKTYDFIIVGGGTAGCVLARRLIESSKSWTVLVLEAGGQAPPQTTVPGYGYFTHLPELTFPYITLQNQMVPVPRVLGGSSALNEVYWNRGSPYGYDLWANLTGDQSWAYKNVLKYFKKSETYRGQFEKTDQHGYKGPIIVSAMEDHPRIQLWQRAATELGYQILDPNGPQMISMGPIEVGTFKGKRMSAYDAYVRPIEKTTSKRLVIQKYSYVNKIEFDENLRAVGVQYTKHGVLNYVQASKEIILSAGVYGTPQILMKSGLGPATELKKLEVEPIALLPVGQRLKDHPRISLFIVVNDTSVGFDKEQDFEFQDVNNFLKGGGGPLGVGHQKAGQTFSPSSRAVEAGESDWADMYIRLHATFPRNTTKPALEPNQRVVNAWGYASRPYSRGFFKVDPQNLSHPFINCSLLCDRRDVDTLLEVVHLMVKIFEGTRAYQSVGARIIDVLSPPACKQYTFKTDEYWRCYIKETVATAFNAVGTVPMGKVGDPTAVLDSKLRVMGVKGLRVIDGSVMPDIPNSNTQAPVYMIAEKGADLVINRWQSVPKGRR